MNISIGYVLGDKAPSAVKEQVKRVHEPCTFGYQNYTIIAVDHNMTRHGSEPALRPRQTSLLVRGFGDGCRLVHGCDGERTWYAGVDMQATMHKYRGIDSFER